jgi:membrane complex biogenesis BtpA family protein
VHLRALPGSPLYDGNLTEIYRRAIRDSMTAIDAGADGLIVENYGDKPYPKRVRDPVVVSTMSVIARSIKEKVRAPLGINILRNSAIEALAVAFAANAQFIRVNVGIEVAVSPEGWLESIAAELIRYRRRIGASGVKVFMDVHVKHAAHLWARPIEKSAKDAVERGLADAVIITGEHTGDPPSPEVAARVKQAVGDSPVIIGSGVNPDNVRTLLKYADGVILGTYVKVDGITENPIDYNRVKLIVDVVRKLRREEA